MMAFSLKQWDSTTNSSELQRAESNESLNVVEDPVSPPVSTITEPSSRSILTCGIMCGAAIVFLLVVSTSAILYVTRGDRQRIQIRNFKSVIDSTLAQSRTKASEVHEKFYTRPGSISKTLDRQPLVNMTMDESHAQVLEATTQADSAIKHIMPSHKNQKINLFSTRSTIFTFDLKCLLLKNAVSKKTEYSALQYKIVGRVPMAARILIYEQSEYLFLEFGCTPNLNATINWPLETNIKIALLRPDNSVFSKLINGLETIGSCVDPHSRSSEVENWSYFIPTVRSFSMDKSGQIRFLFEIVPFEQKS